MDGGPQLWRGKQVAMPPRFWVQYVVRGTKLCENVAEASKKLYVRELVLELIKNNLMYKHIQPSEA